MRAMHYSKIENNKIEQEEDGEEGLLLRSAKPHAEKSRLRIQRCITSLSYMIVAIAAYVLGTFTQSTGFDRDSVCTHHVSRDSPIVNDVSITYSTKQFNGSLFHENIYRQSGSPEVDQAWEALGVNFRSVTIPEKDARQAGLRHEQVKINKKYGGGYPANVEGLHQLHCLNLVRQSLYYNYDYYKKMGTGAFVNEDYVVKAHVSHCLDIVRQQLMCTVDLGFLGQVWTNPENPRPFVDFNTKHTCRNFEAVRKWAEEHQLPEVTELEADFLEPPMEGDLIYAEIP